MSSEYPIVVPRGEREFLRGKRLKVDDDYFDEMGPKQYWMLGLYASDGNVRGNQIYISQSGEHGLDILKYVKEELQCETPISSYKPSAGKTIYSLRFSSPKIIKVFSAFGIVPNKTQKYSLPQQIDETNIRPFLAGYIDGDGCITLIRRKDMVGMLCASFVGNEMFIKECSKYIPVPGKIRKHSMSDIYEIRWYSKKAINVCEWIYGDMDIYHSYKYESFIQGKESHANMRDSRFAIIHQSIIDDFNSGKLKTVRECYEQYGTNPTLTYGWFKKWYQMGLLNRDYRVA